MERHYYYHYTNTLRGLYLNSFFGIFYRYAYNIHSKKIEEARNYFSYNLLTTIYIYIYNSLMNAFLFSKRLGGHGSHGPPCSYATSNFLIWSQFLLSKNKCDTSDIIYSTIFFFKIVGMDYCDRNNITFTLIYYWYNIYYVPSIINHINSCWKNKTCG